MTEPVHHMPAVLRNARIALVHDYLNQMGGAEKVMQVFAEMFPHAPIFTSVYDPQSVSEYWRGKEIRTSFLQKMSPRLRVAKAMLPFYPTAFEQFDFRGYDLVLSSTTAFAKGILTRPETCHVCYCNNPTRFLWMYHDYFEHERFPRPVQAVFPWLVTPLRVWDYAAAQRVDYFLAGSGNAARRIAKYYRRSSDILQPCIDSSFFHPDGVPGEYFLVVSRLQSYKRIDLAIEACNRLRKPLRIAGSGSDRARLEALAGPTVTFLGRISDLEVRSEMQRCQALIFPGEEDFGLTPVEAQACGRPVVAFRAGGALETVVDGKTGVFFTLPTVESLCTALEQVCDGFEPAEIREHALQFDRAAFEQRLYGYLEQRLLEYRDRPAADA